MSAQHAPHCRCWQCIDEENRVLPRWVCLEGMNADELAAYDYGCRDMEGALLRILDGKDTGAGVSNEPWETLRRRVLALVELAKAQGLPS